MSNSTLKDFLNKHGRCIHTIGNFKIYPPIICNDGYFMSVQASAFHSCEPRETLESFDYELVEVRCSEEDVSILQCYNNDNSGNYCMVPVEAVEALILKHNGIDEDAVSKVIIEENNRNNII